MLVIIISCIASFRQLFMKQTKARYVPPAGPHSIRQKLLSSFKSKLSLPSINPSTFKVSFAHQTQKDATLTSSSSTHMMPLEQVYVSHGVDVASEAMKADDGTSRDDTYGSTFQIHSQSAEHVAGSTKL